MSIFTRQTPFVCFLVSILLRFAIGLGPYSGEKTPPKYGDYEAQRHFMEIAYNLPVTEWYTYDPSYWGLDYPPLTAYHSGIMGKIADMMMPEWMEFEKSRGYESDGHKLFMRITVIISDLLVYVPAVWFFCFRAAPTIDLQLTPIDAKYPLFLVLLCPPALLIIDHGHFQYNSVMLGFVLWMINFLSWKMYFCAAVSFCLALGFKHMSLYYSLPVFFYMLGCCFRSKTRTFNFSLSGLKILISLGLGVILTFGLLLFPFYYYGGVDGVLQIFVRLFPVQRGLFEDKVANFWVATSIIIKYKEKFTVEFLFRISAIITLLASLSSCYFAFTSSSLKRFLYCLISGSLAFFLFSFQVHEKSILIPMLPVLLLCNAEPRMCRIFMNFAMFSMFPLLSREGNEIGYFALMGMWNQVAFDSETSTYSKSNGHWKLMDNVETILYAKILLIHLGEAFINPPAKLPHIFIMMNMILSAGVFISTFLYVNYRLFASHYSGKRENSRENFGKSRKKEN